MQRSRTVSFSGSEFSRIRLPRSASEMRVMANRMDQTSMLLSPTSSTNVISFNHVCFRPYHIPCFRLLYSLFLLIILWISASVSLFCIENFFGYYVEHELANKIDQRRSAFQIRFTRFHSHIPMSSPEWDETAAYLIGRHAAEYFPSSVQRWTLFNSFIFIFELMTTVGRLPGYSTFPLDNTGRLLVLLWAPLGIFLYYYSLWCFSYILYKLPVCLQISVLFFAIIIFVGRLAFISTTNHISIDDFIDISFILLNIGWPKKSEDLSLAFFLAFHPLFWSFIALAIRHFLRWRGTLYRDVLTEITVSELLPRLHSPHFAFSDLMKLFRSKSFINRAKYYFLTKTDEFLINEAINELREQARCPSSVVITLDGESTAHCSNPSCDIKASLLL